MKENKLCHYCEIHCAAFITQKRFSSLAFLLLQSLSHSATHFCSVKLEMGYDLTSGHFIVPFKLLSTKIFIFWSQEAKSVTAQRGDKKESERKKSMKYEKYETEIRYFCCRCVKISYRQARFPCLSYSLYPLPFCLFPDFLSIHHVFLKVIVKNENTVIYSLSCLSKHVWHTFFFFCQTVYIMGVK